ncbi:MAG: head GIN domain-containing protein [Alteraurantiacibacter sp.]
MRFEKLLKAVGPFVAMAAATALTGCDGMDVKFNGEDGVPLSDLDITGTPPTGVALGGPDIVIVTTGDDFAIDVDGTDEAADRMRFALADGMLGIGRARGNSGKGDVATINITLPAVSSIAIGGSGRIKADRLHGEADIAVGGSGRAEVASVESDRLDVVIGGSGSATARGRVERLDISIGGSGIADLAQLYAENAEVSIGGSGSARFASNGRVNANIGGSGDVRVRGTAECTQSTVGSGRLICEDDEP